eukprot:jgi/Mesvir1/12071/Mv00353-RA.4
MASAGEWFGGPHLMRQHWPLNCACMEVSPYYPFDNGPTGLNNLVGSHWVTSHGLLCMVDPDTPFLHVGINAPRDGAGGGIQRGWGVGSDNATREILPFAEDEHRKGDGLLRLQSRVDFHTPNVSHPLSDWVPASGTVQDPDHLTLRVVLVAAADAKDAATQALSALPHPSSSSSPPSPLSSLSPPEGPALFESLSRLLRRPIWSSWARFYSAVTQAMVERYAEEIVGKGFPRAVMEIDDRWQVNYGDFDFDPAKFPDPQGMVVRLHELGFLVTVWVMPFAEETSEAYQEGGPKGYFVARGDAGDNDPDSCLFRWWQPSRVAALDVTNPLAVEWFVSRLQRFQQKYGVDGFKFDAGEPCFLPGNFRTFAPLRTPAEYTQLYLQNVVARFPLSEVRTGHKSAHVPTLTRIGDRFSTWSLANGLASIIPTALTSSLLGYPFVLPDMVGGNGYFDQKPDEALMVRWAQASVLMPSVQFSIAPWDVGEEASRLCLDALKLREHFQPVLDRLADEAYRTSRPICRPLWWLEPSDVAAFSVADQFAVGDDIIVAPVMQAGASTRDVYIPSMEAIRTGCVSPLPTGCFRPLLVEGCGSPFVQAARVRSGCATRVTRQGPWQLSTPSLF